MDLSKEVVADIAVIGGGAAGFMAAVSAAAEGRGRLSVVVIEKGKPLSKLLLTGGGRCNLTNATFDVGELSFNYPRGDKFLRSVFSRFGPRETMEWFRSRGMALRIEDGRRVFPASGDAREVRDLLLKEAGKWKVKVTNFSPVTAISRRGKFFFLRAGRGEAAALKVILAAGGDVRRRPPSGYGLAESLGHKVTDLWPSLTGLVVQERWAHRLVGLTLRDPSAEAHYGGRKVATARGDLLFTHRGISGPLAFRLSALCSLLDFGPRATLEVRLNLAPDLTRAEMEHRLAAQSDAHPRKSAVNDFSIFTPRALTEALLGEAGVPPGKEAGGVSRQERRAFLDLLARLPLTVTGREPESELVTAGGVDLDQVDQKTMESRIVPGLYFCGEILDIDGFTGGYNLQAAWSTGRLAGLAAAVAAVAPPAAPAY